LKRPAAVKKNKRDFPKRIGPVFRTGAFLFSIAFSSESVPWTGIAGGYGSREENALNQGIERHTGFFRNGTFARVALYLPLSDDREDFMQAAIDRIMLTYDLLMNRSSAASAEAHASVTGYLAKLFEAGETDIDRLTVCGLTYLRELDGSVDPVKAGFTGL
jgi:hypothetical protein